MSQKYSVGTARAIAKRIFDTYRKEILVASSVSNVPRDWLAGLTGMENPNCREWPDSRSYRFEAGVYAKLKKVQSNNPVYRSYNNITKGMLVGLSDDALKNLCRSFGQTQIMAYWILNVLSGASVAHLRDPKIHYIFACAFMLADDRMKRYVGKSNFAQVCHIWNSGQVWNGKTSGIRTHSPNYMYNCELVRKEYLALIQQATPLRCDFPVISTVSGLVEFAVSGPSDSVLGREVNNKFAYIWKRNAVSDNVGTVMFDEQVPDLSGLDENLHLEPEIGSIPEAQVPQDVVKPGYKTSQGIVTFIFGLVTMALSGLGYNSMASKISSVNDMIVSMIPVIGPLLAFVPVIITYINSRGKTYSNALWTTALSNRVGTDIYSYKQNAFSEPFRQPFQQMIVERLPDEAENLLGYVPEIQNSDPGFNVSELGQSLDSVLESIDGLNRNISTLNDNVVIVNERTKENTESIQVIFEKLYVLERSPAEDH